MEYNDVEYADLKRRIDGLIAMTSEAADYESKKGTILAASDAYVAFVAAAARTSRETVRTLLLELSADREFFDMMAPGLAALASYARGVQTGEIRVHSHTIYVVVRVLQPKIMVETGVANGKSSALILRAMQKNGLGRLYSVDLPTFEGASPDIGRGTIPRGHQPGWLVPETLKPRWNLSIGDAADVLPKLQAEVPAIDIFFHDSLHTYEHMSFELETAKKWLRRPGAVLCDDVRENEAFVVASQNCVRHAFGTFGVFWMDAANL